MTSRKTLLAVMRLSSQSASPYMLVGGLLSYYGIGRSTKDADFVVELGDSIASLTRLLGPPFGLTRR